MAATPVRTSVRDRIRNAPPWVGDTALAAMFVVAGLLRTGRPSHLYKARDALAVTLILAGTLPYVARRTAPLAVFVTSLLAIGALFALGYEGGALPMVVAVGAYTVAAYRPLHEALLGAALVNATLLVIAFASPSTFGGAEVLMSAISFGAVMLLGWTMQSRRARIDAVEREQREAALRAAADERLRIAQELHDVVAHSLGVIAVQAGVGLHVLDTQPDEARRALEHVSRTSRTSLGEIRQLLGLIRTAEPGASLEPAPGVDGLRRLAAEVTDAGLPVDLAISAPSDVPPGVELAAYRIVQEALTNALRHAEATRATVEVTGCPEGLHVIVVDDGRGCATGVSSSGHGLVGMRERVAVYGGELIAGPSPAGGFRVDATIPYKSPT